MLLYKKVHERRSEIHELANEIEGDLLARYRRRKIIRRKYAEELDDIEAYGEERFTTIGMVRGVLLFVVYTERGARVRLISARRATRYEQDDYYQQDL